MSLNITCVIVNGTELCSQPSAGVGLPVGLSVFFLLVLLAAAVGVYVKWRSSGWWRLDRPMRGKTVETVPREPQYSTMGGPQTQDGQESPLYENYGGPPPHGRQGPPDLCPRSPVDEPKEEDFYCQSDVADDAIYYNDPSCSLSMLPEPHEGEELYIIPDAL